MLKRLKQVLFLYYSRSLVKSTAFVKVHRLRLAGLNVRGEEPRPPAV
jgi:hypothetical protein